MANPPMARLVRTFSLGEFGASVVKLADLNDDGQPELLMLQTCGQLRAANLETLDLGVDQVDRTLFCLTAVDLQGRLLWQDGRPYERDFPYTGHGGDCMLLAEDIDGDGRVEVAVIRHQQLALLDGATGRCKRAVPLPADNLVSMFSAQLGPRGAGRNLLVKAGDRAYPPWEYANPVMAFNPDLSVLREPFAVRGAGHNLVAADVDGDGRDELFIGYSRFDSDLNELWRLDLGRDFDYAHDHADQVSLADVNGDGQLEVLYAGSEDFFVASLDGRILWRTHAGHSQTSIEGPWGPDGEKRIIMSEKNRGLWGLDAAGNVRWHRTELNGYATHDVRWRRGAGQTNWPLFKPQLKPVARRPYETGPQHSRGLWPSFLDDDGSPLDVLPWRDDYAQPRQLIRAARSYDAGVGYSVLLADLDGDGLDEIIVCDRRRVWVFHSPG